MSTPLRAQYLRLKQPFPDALLLFRLGDVYELYDEDARLATHELGVTPTVRAFAEGERGQMCLLPYHAVEGAIKRLVARGYKVAIAEQINSLHTAKGLVAREVVRVVTPSSAVEALRRPSSDRVAEPACVEPDGSGVLPPSREMTMSIASTSESVGGVASVSASDVSEDGRAVASTVQLTLFDLSAGDADAGR